MTLRDGSGVDMGRPDPGILILAAALACGDRSMERVGTIEGEMTWEAGFPDGSRCGYTRTFQGIEDRSAPWLCPECEVIWRVDLVGFEGEPCYARLQVPSPAEVEWLGWGGGRFYRAPRINGRLFETGDARMVGEALEVEDDTWDETGAGKVTFGITGTFRLGHTHADPMHGFEPPRRYACGWNRADPRAYDGDWTVARGRTVPDGWFHDPCGEPVRLHDLKGRYLVVDVAATDCPPCVEMARTEAAFVDRMRREGLEVEVVTLLAPTLGAVLDPTPQVLLEAWSDTFGHGAPVLADRGWGVFVAGRSVATFGYPTSVIVAPDLSVIDVLVGFADWEPFVGRIRTHAGR